MTILKTENLTKTYGSGENTVHALQNVNLSIENGEFAAIVGTSGSGKSTLLHMLGGLDTPTSGNVTVDGKDIFSLNDEELTIFRRRKIGFIFQAYNLVPVLNLYENIVLPLELDGRKIDKSFITQITDTLGLSKRLNSLPNQLSGGQQQRVAIARALANKPHILLLDEPLGALDLKLRKDMQRELKNIQQELGITFIYVTHDQEEALSMSDTVVVMDKGKIQQIGTPEDIYNEPVNAFVADFIGESNIVDAIMLEDYLVTFGGVKFKCLDKGFDKNEFVEAVVRPEDILIREPGTQASLTGKVTSVTFKGVHFEILVDVNGFIWMIQTTRDDIHVDDTIGMHIEPDAIHIMKRSEYSGEFGDYSSFSDEMDHISDASYNWEDENEEE